ncbi:MAG: leucyl aminopeptidase [Actinomycetia bacterium]|nr:leucyl aminopeptidase [Actinomycetes bacterium]
MPVSFELSSTAPARVRTDLLALPVFAGRVLGPGADALGDGIVDFLAEAGFEGKPGEVLALPANDVAAKAVLVIGLGEQDNVTVDGLRLAAATLTRKASQHASFATTLLDAAPAELDRGDVAQAIAEGVILGGYQFLRYKGDGKAAKLRKVTVVRSGRENLQWALERGAVIGEAVTWARDMVNEPAADKSPAAFAAAAKKLLRGKGVTVEVLSGPQLAAAKLGGLIGVGQGSDQPPRFVKVTYSPRGAKGSLAFVGKGVVFDSGGLSLKPPGGMETMKTDMAGGAAVLAAMSTLADLGVETKVVGYVPMVENMPSGKAIRPGDVLTIRNGKTVEVLNTDAEGRLILADALSMASEAKPDGIVDLATLTGACLVALGDKYAGLMGNDDDWRGQVADAAERASEKVWALPLPTEYRKQLESEIADLKNIGTSYGGALTAGLFLQEFVADVPWAHLDIAGPARAGSDDGYNPRGGTGFGVRTLVELAEGFQAS